MRKGRVGGGGSSLASVHLFSWKLSSLHFWQSGAIAARSPPFLLRLSTIREFSACPPASQGSSMASVVDPHLFVLQVWSYSWRYLWPQHLHRNCRHWRRSSCKTHITTDCGHSGWNSVSYLRSFEPGEQELSYPPQHGTWSSELFKSDQYLDVSSLATSVSCHRSGWKAEHI